MDLGKAEATLIGFICDTLGILKVCDEFVKSLDFGRSLLGLLLGIIIAFGI